MRVLVDCDGVLADFLGRFLISIQKVTGLKHDPEVTTYRIEDAIRLEPNDYERVYEQVEAPGWCASVSPIPGAQEGVSLLRKQGHTIVIVTSPWKGHYSWHRERLWWLKHHFDIAEKQVIFTSTKEWIDGDVLIEDNPDNLLKWKSAGYGRHGLILDQPYNRSAPSQATRSNSESPTPAVELAKLKDLLPEARCECLHSDGHAVNCRSRKRMLATLINRGRP